MITRIAYTFGLCAMTLMLAQCSKQKTKQQMSLDELTAKAETNITRKKNDDAISYLEEIMARFPDSPKVAEYKMKLADLYAKEGRNDQAHEMFEHYNQFYPSDSKAEYAKYQALKAMHRQTLSTDCDQTETEKTIEHCKEYLANNAYTAYRSEIEGIQNECQNKLIDKEVYVFNFYVQQEQYEAAHNRLKNLKEKFASNAELKPQLMYLECKLAQRQNKKDDAQKTLDALIQTYPESRFASKAQAMVHQPKFVF